MKRTTQEGLLNVYIFVLKQKQTDRHRGRERKRKSNETKWQKVRRVEQMQKSKMNSSETRLSQVEIAPEYK